jgi:predicted nucleotidyltransferase
MDLKKVTADLREIAGSSHSPTASWYLFGSLAKQAELPGDIDLLIIYKNDSDAIALRELLAEYGRRNPLHLMLLRDDEEKELHFVESEQAVLIYRP